MMTSPWIASGLLGHVNFSCSLLVFRLLDVFRCSTRSRLTLVNLLLWFEAGPPHIHTHQVASSRPSRARDCFYGFLTHGERCETSTFIFWRRLCDSLCLSVAGREWLRARTATGRGTPRVLTLQVCRLVSSGVEQLTSRGHLCLFRSLTSHNRLLYNVNNAATNTAFLFCSLFRVSLSKTGVFLIVLIDFSAPCFVSNTLLCVWLSPKVSISFDYTQLALASTLWLTGH